MTLATQHGLTIYSDILPADPDGRGNHTSEAFRPLADDADRLALVQVASDRGRDAYQLDSGQWWRAKGVTGQWQALGSASGVAMIDRVNTALTVAATTVETSIYSKVIAAGAMGPNGILKCVLGGTFATVGAASTWRLRIKFGGVTLYDSVTASIGAGATLRAWLLDFQLCNRNAANAQTGGGAFNMSEAGTPTVGAGDLNNTDTNQAPIRLAAGAVDTTANQTLEVTAQHSNAGAGVATVREYAALTLYSL